MARFTSGAESMVEGQGDHARCALARDVDRLHYLAYAEMLPRNGEFTDVDAWLNRYIVHSAKSGASLPIRVKLRVKQGRTKEAVTLVNNWFARRRPGRPLVPHRCNKRKRPRPYCKT